ncbi:MAG: tRNA (adenosine(37)-N6)-threonylcarbamoyltransferase complex ATPase subunit type 1 TsaE, partial [Candidatus Margulisiibacteriota bacterium]
QISKNTKHTEKIAKAFLNKLKPTKTSATVVGLFGELGTGKTTFTKFIAKELKIKRKVNSPTFVIMKKYKLRTSPQALSLSRRGGSFKFLFHLDAYRLKNEKELLHLGWEEIISNPEHLIFIEWPERVIKILPKKHHKVHIEHTKEGYRNFKIKGL